MRGILLDTHVWIWAQRNESGRLSASVLAEIEEHQRAGTACISTFSVLELARMAEWDGYDLGESIESFLFAGTSDGGLRILDISPTILIASIRLPGEMHRDPADRIIVATAREHGLALFTHDKAILRYAAAGHVNARKV